MTEAAATFKDKLTDQTVEEEGTVTLQCEVTKPDAEVKWFKNGKPVKKSKSMEIVKDGTTHKLNIKNAKKDDAATYSATVGKDKTEAKVNVEGKIFK